jgi:carbon monoxide dehydrogenase subunit G
MGMASIHEEISTTAAPEQVWDALRDVGAIHERVAPGFVVDTVLEDGARIVTFANGFVARELLVDVDDGARRLAYAVVGGQLTHHNGVFTVAVDGTGSRVTWRADLLPDAAAETVGGMMRDGIAVMKETFDRS